MAEENQYGVWGGPATLKWLDEGLDPDIALPPGLGPLPECFLASSILFAGSPFQVKGSIGATPHVVLCLHTTQQYLSAVAKCPKYGHGLLT